MISPAPVPASARVGMNLAELADYSPQWAFVDVFKQSRPWIESQVGKTAYDDRGFPVLAAGQSVQTVMVRELKGHYPAGVYTATFTGTAGVQMNQFDVRTVTAGKNTIQATVVPADGGLLLTASGGALTDCHVWMPGFEKGGTTFHPTFLDRLAPFGVIRFMDWQKTNNSSLVQWSQRPKPTDARYTTDAGVPVEVMVDLANTRGVHPWFCIPHQADDTFVRQFATVVRDRLDKRLKVYIEYSNEVWNFGFQQAHWAQDQGNALNLGDPPGSRFYSQRAVAIFKIWEDVFGGRDRLVRVLASQSANAWLSEQIVSWQDAYKYADALAVAPYFGNDYGDPANADKTSGMTTDQLIAGLQNELNGTNRQRMLDQAAVARKYGLQLVAYEGGQHLVGYGGAENNDTLTQLFLATNRDARMADLYRQHLQNWAAAGGGLYVAYAYVYAPGKWGSWGALEYQDQPSSDAPKYRALVDFAKK